MPEHTLPDALHPQQEDAADELQLRGGGKGFSGGHLHHPGALHDEEGVVLPRG